MAVSTEARSIVRAAFGGRCGYCGVSETSVGGELEIDHFHPLAAGGSDDIENLVYACTACNRFKGDYAPAPDAPESLRLLRPQRDDFGAHVEETVHGRLIGLTPRGWFHIQRLHLTPFAMPLLPCWRLTGPCSGRDPAGALRPAAGALRRARAYSYTAA
ncbi:MAG TPA: HNH endonuclease signature motif containing protein [Sorangium sp.]|nr:HNH endonuclease signature motif containing protein [Sorangium sp.]